jgi:CO dehydrogenase maturation factor
MKVAGSYAAKLAVTGKGGVGKTTLSAALALLFARAGGNVLAVDADPQANLAAALGIPEALERTIVPIAERHELIEERTGAKPGKSGQVFKLNPEVADVAEILSVRHDGVALVVLGGIESGGAGCACPENIFLQALVSDLVLFKNETLVMDMAAGFEHLGRATARGVDHMLVVVEPGRRAVECAWRICELAREIGLQSVRLVGNKVTGPEDERFLREAFPGREWLGMIPFSEKIREADKSRRSVLDEMPDTILGAYRRIAVALEGES